MRPPESARKESSPSREPRIDGAAQPTFFERTATVASAALAGAALLVAVGQLLRPGFKTVNILFDPPLPVTISCLAQAALAIALLLNPRRPRGVIVRRLAILLIAAFAVFAVVDSARYYVLWSRERIQPGRMLPLSIYLLAILLARLAQWLRQSPRVPLVPACRDRLVQIVAILLGAACLPLIEQAFFGSTDYQRNADVIVVLGAGVHADGSPTDALADRVRTGVRLYQDRRAGRLLMTGGIDPNHGVSEPRVMRRLAVESGVPADRITLDETGRNTFASADSVTAIMRAAGWRACLVVSHDYHLPRIKRLFDRDGLSVCTVAARETYPLRAKPYFRLREVLAWHYYLLTGG